MRKKEDIHFLGFFNGVLYYLFAQQHMTKHQTIHSQTHSMISDNTFSSTSPSFEGGCDAGEGKQEHIES
jgi:hypothetical protein